MTETATAPEGTTTTDEGQGKENKPAELVFEHLKLIKEDGINVGQLPANIRGKMGALKMVVARYQKNPTANILTTIKKQDVVIADAIQTWKEGEDEKARQASPEAVAQREKEAKEKADAIAKAKADADAEANKPDVKMEKAVREKLVDGKISTSDLKSIIGRNPSTFKSLEKIGTLTLKKVWLQEIWVEQK